MGKSNHTFLLILLMAGLVCGGYSQQWQTTGGNNMKNGQSRLTGPTGFDVVWTVTSQYYSVFGNSVFTCGDRFVTSRTMFTPVYHGVIECRKLSDGSLLWEFQPNPAAIMYAIGFNEHAVYAHDYNSGAMYALDPLTGNVKWTFPYLYMFGGNTGLVFSAEGDPLYTNYRFNRHTGQPVWYNNYILPVLPNAGFALHGSTFYHYIGSIGSPKHIIAINVQTGQIKYQTPSLPGDADQEEPIILGPGNRVYLKRDGANFWAFTDNGSQFVENFNTPNAFDWYVGIDHDSTIVGSINNKLHRMNYRTGEIIASAPFNIETSRPLITVDRAGKIYVNNAQPGTGKMYCISPDLQTILWMVPAPYGYYCDPNLSKDGLMVLTRQGAQIYGIRTNSLISQLKPVADFYTWTRDISKGEFVQFYDNTSYMPQNWLWTFEGGTPSTSTDPNPVVQYVQPGAFSVTLKVNNQHGEDLIVKESYIIVTETVSSQLSIIQEDFTVFPNPFQNQITLRLPLSFRGSTEITVLDQSGNKCYTSSHLVSSPVTLNLEHLPAGIYFLRLVNGNNALCAKIMKL